MAGGETIFDGDAGLNKLGHEQASELAEKLKDVKFDAIVVSPLKRTLETAKVINKYHGLPIVIDEGLRERKGGMVGTKIWHDLFDFDRNLQPEGGETVREFFERVYEAIERLKKEYHDKDVLVVSSGGVNQAFYAYFNGLEWKGNMRLDPMRNTEIRKYDLGYDDGYAALDVTEYISGFGFPESIGDLHLKTEEFHVSLLRMPDGLDRKLRKKIHEITAAQKESFLGNPPVLNGKFKRVIDDARGRESIVEMVDFPNLETYRSAVREVAPQVDFSVPHVTLYTKTGWGIGLNSKEVFDKLTSDLSDEEEKILRDVWGRKEGREGK
jgi:probable phosphoglycerate mutase